MLFRCYDALWNLTGHSHINYCCIESHIADWQRFCQEESEKKGGWSIEVFSWLSIKRLSTTFQVSCIYNNHLNRTLWLCFNTNLPQIQNDHTKREMRWDLSLSHFSTSYLSAAHGKSSSGFIYHLSLNCVYTNKSITVYLALQHMHTISVGRGSTRPGPSTLPKQMENYACWLESYNES